ncbi:MAG: hypothetical protein HYX92_02940 [Chloroflexi bacterium]|nr:hypothetical protein [Chloroflexota bacterium]
MELKSERIDIADYFEWLELAFQRRWTDGLPVAPPTAAKVEEMVAYAKRDPSDVIGKIPPKYGIATIEKLAINAVMGGCLKEYFPVVIAAVEAMLEPEFNLNGIQTTTHCNEPLTIVNGPIVAEIGMKTREAVFGGGGARANGAIGRAVRLVLWNLGGCYPGEPDKTTFSHPGRWTYCIAEDEEGSPWEPLHVERGLPPGSSAVTVFSCEAPHSIFCAGTPRQLLARVCYAMATTASNNFHFQGQMLLAINSEHAATFKAEGWSKADIKAYVWEHARVPLGRIKEGLFVREYAARSYPKWIDVDGVEDMVPIGVRPDEIHIVVAGGPGKFCMCCPSWGHDGGNAVTKPIRLP